MNNDIRFMQIAIAAAKAGVGKTFPKPSVGAVLVKNNRVISIAHTSQKGIHAEPQVIQQAGSDAKGAIIYVTLEPCNHYGRTPPCSEAVIKAGIKRVVIANRDINPKAAGGIEKLKAAGIEVTENICSKEAMEINRPFFYTVQKNRPYIIAKIGASADGKIALSNGKSQYITSEIARNYGQMLRSKVDGILVGINTILTDNPQLSCRLDGLGKKLTKIVLDSKNRIPENAKILDESTGNTLIFSSKNRNLQGAEIIETPTTNNGLDLNFILRTLAEKGHERILIEGGSKVLASFLEANLIDEIHIFYAAKFLGGNSLSAISDLNLTELPENNFNITETRKLGPDSLIILKNKNLD